MRVLLRLFTFVSRSLVFCRKGKVAHVILSWRDELVLTLEKFTFIDSADVAEFQQYFMKELERQTATFTQDDKMIKTPFETLGEATPKRTIKAVFDASEAAAAPCRWDSNKRIKAGA